jgi:hypothetical protein
LAGLIKAKHYDVVNRNFYVYGDCDESVNGVFDSTIGEALTKYDEESIV